MTGDSQALGTASTAQRTGRLHWLLEIAVEAAGDGAGPPSVDARAPIHDLWKEARRLADLTDAELAEQVAGHFSIPVADFEMADEPAIRFVPEKLARNNLVFPLRVTDQEIIVATCDPTDLGIEEQLRFVAGRAPVFHVAPPGLLEKTIEAYYRPESAAENLLTDIGADVEGIQLVDDQELPAIDAEDASGEPVIKLANLILREAVNQRASDVHVAPGPSVGTVHLRVDGVLQLRMRIPMPVLHRIVSRLKILGGMDITDRLRPQDGRARIRVGDEYYDLRVSTVPTRNAEKAVVRVLYSDTAPGLADLKMPEKDVERVSNMLAHRDSIVLVTGPTGSGKTTTLYAALQELNTGDVNIMTVEDPIEYELPGITQIQVQPRRGVTFAGALRAILRQDPDIILLGEIRDLETAEIAAQAAQTGHLVLATLHTNDAVGVVSRLHDLGLPLASIADSVCGMVAQRLLRKICPECAEPVGEALSEDEEILAAQYGVRPTVRAVGCAACSGIGYQGRTPVVETVLSSARLRQLINDGSGHDALREEAINGGMTPLLNTALDLARQGVTTLEDVERTLGESGRADATATVEMNVVVPRPVDQVEVVVGPGDAGDNADGTEDDEDRPIRALLADDDPVIRQIVRALLEKNGFEAFEVEDGVSALERLNADEHFDLVISDLDMPRLSGHDLIRLARGSARTAGLPIVVLTGEEDPESEVRLIEEGADDYIRKPIDPERFLARIRAVLRRARGD